MKKLNERDVEIDQYKLDEEWVNQPQLYNKYATLAADARRDYDESKAQLDLVDAELDQAIRSNPDEFGLSKVTEASISSVIKVHQKHKNAVQETIDTRHHMDICLGLVSAMDHRKVALQKMVDLFMADYFSKPKASDVSKEKMEEVERKSIRRKGRRERDD